MEEYARIRLTLSWRSASRLPATMEAMATAVRARKSVEPWSELTGSMKRSRRANTAPLETVAT